MFEAFIWMFKKEEANKQFIYLISFILILSLTLFGFVFSMTALGNSSQSKLITVIGILAITSIVIFTVTGYFWELTSEIIERKEDIIASSIYDNKIKKKYNFNLPELKIFKLLWRGFASFIATIMLPLPYLALIYTSISAGEYDALPIETKISAIIVFSSLYPALLWNYAKENSIFAVLNIPKAVFIFGNYPLKYISTVLLLGLICGANAYIDMSLKTFLKPQTLLVEQNPLFIILNLLGLTFLIIKGCYFLFVNAYILGTLTPASEY